MPFSHHSHSGQFCPGHAKDLLEEIIQTAISKRMEVFALTEHMPRHDEDRYPEEVEENLTLSDHTLNQSNYYDHALLIRQKYSSQISIPIGFESEWIRPSSAALIQQSLSTHPFDFFIGSVHHVHTVPIDYDHALYSKARSIAGGTDEKLFEDYFDAQYDLMKELRPPVIGHFDLIRLKSDDPNQSLKGMGQGVWEKVCRNLDFAGSYGAILEINTSAWRKGLREPYPTGEICREYLSRGGRFCLSDDSHGIDQVATNYEKLPNFLGQTGIQTLYSLKHSDQPAENPSDSRFPHTEIVAHAWDEVRRSSFWRVRAK